MHSNGKKFIGNRKNHLHTMKNIIIAILALLLNILAIQSCEKPIEETNKGETNITKPDTGNSNPSKKDNGGWINDSTSTNGENTSIGDTLNVAAFINNTEFGDIVWVKGYIVGCANGSKGNQYCFCEPFEFSTAVLLADNKNETDQQNTISIQLTSGSAIRKIVNLVDNPENIGKTLVVAGRKTTYLKLNGIKEIYDFFLR